MINWVIVQTVGNRNDAQLAVSLLESCGIRAMVNGDDLGGQNDYLGYTFGINVLVPDEQRDEALAILSAPVVPADELTDDDLKQLPGQYIPSRRVKILQALTRISWGIVFVFFVYELFEGSANLSGPWQISGFFILIGLLPMIIGVEYIRQREKDRRRHRERLN